MPKINLKIFILMAFAILGISSLLILRANSKPKEIHIHAGFAVFENNKQLDFSDFKYMKISPCNTEENDDIEVDEQLEKAHLHDQVGDVVHVHRENAEWGDFFENIKYDIDDNTVSFINGKGIKDLKDTKIAPYDSLVMLVGKNDEKLALSKAIKKSHIQEIEKRSENCAGPKANSTEEEIRASFAIYTNGTFRAFSDPRYHNLSEDIYINPSNPNTINVDKPSLTWSDFFNTLPMKLEKDCLTTGTGQTFCTNKTYVIQFFINGAPDPNVLDKKINVKDKLLVTYEALNSPRIKEQIISIPNTE